MEEPGRVGEGPAGPADDPRGLAQRGRSRPGKVVLDATSGNTGIAYAMIGAALGYPVTLCLPENVTPERKRILRAYGAELVFTNPLEGSDGAIREARRRYAADPERYFYPDQYNNDFNWRAHYETTGPEIIAQTAGGVTHFVAGPRHERHLHGHRPAAARRACPASCSSRCSPTRRSTASRA